MLESPQIVHTDAQLAAVIRLTIPREEIQAVMGPAIADVFAAIAAQGVDPAGPVFSHHLRLEPGIFDFEVGVPVRAPISPAGRVKGGFLPAATVVRTVYTGPYEGLPQAWGEFMALLEGQGHALADEAWESYLHSPAQDPDPGSWRTELNRPLQSA